MKCCSKVDINIMLMVGVKMVIIVKIVKITG